MSNIIKKNPSNTYLKVKKYTTKIIENSDIIYF